MRITVVGDTLLDEDLEGTSTRLSPDGAVPVVDLASRTSRAGGGGLVATLLARDGHDVELVTALSDDAGADRLRRHLRGVRIVAADALAPTPVKSRLRANGAPFCRIDEGCAPAPAPDVGDAVLAAIERADALVVADYGRGLAAHPDVRAALERRGAEVPLVWDPHPRGAAPVTTAALVTPNLPEAAAAVGAEPEVSAAGGAAERLRERYGCAAVAVTLGSAGALLHEGHDAPLLVPARAVDAADTCGAGDRFAATAVAVLAGGGSAADAVREAVTAASAYLAAGGVAVLAEAGDAEDPAPEPAEAPETPGAAEARGSGPRAVVEAVRARGGVVVATGGCFDLIHAGHVRTLEAARALGDCLIVCLNSDASVRRLKGPQRPIVGESDRAELLRALACVDEVLVFEEDGPEAVLAELRPDVWVKGGDYSVDSLPEAKLLESWGGRTVTLPYHLGRSTTGLAAKLARVG